MSKVEFYVHQYKKILKISTCRAYHFGMVKQATYILKCGRSSHVLK